MMNIQCKRAGIFRRRTRLLKKRQAHLKQFHAKKLPRNVPKDALFEKNKHGQAFNIQAKKLCLNTVNSFLNDGMNLIESCNETARRCGVSPKSMYKMAKEKLFTKKVISNNRHVSHVQFRFSCLFTFSKNSTCLFTVFKNESCLFTFLKE